MSTEYAGVATYPITITIPDGSDADDAASAAVALMQLADRCEALRAGHDLVFYDATFHGASNFVDGTVDATVERINLAASTTMGIDASAELFLSSGVDFRVQANRDGNLDFLRDLLVDVTRNVIFNIGGGAAFNAAGALGFGGTSADFLGGVVHFSPAGIGLGSSTSTPTEVRGQLTAQHNATFIAGKTVSLLGSTNAADLTASALKGTVSSSVGITYSGQGRAHYRDHEMTDAELLAGGGDYMMHPDIADFFYVTALTGHRSTKLDVGGTSIVGDVIEVSTLGMTGGFKLDVTDHTYTVLLTMMSTSKCWSRWKRMAGGLWRLMGVADG